jgi:hypothetical protein
MTKLISAIIVTLIVYGMFWVFVTYISPNESLKEITPWVVGVAFIASLFGVQKS